MKKLLSLSIALCAVFGFALNGQAEVPAQGYYEAGQKVFDFSYANNIYQNFNIYSEEEGQGFYATDGYLCSVGRAETKAILKNPSTISQYSLEADFYPSFASGGLDVGFYIHASGAGNRIDDIKAYNINLEKSSFSNILTVKIHSFNHSYVGELTANSVTIKSCPVNLRVDVNENNIKAYVNHSKNPIINYTLTSWEPGGVGFRAFRGVANKISNFKIYSSDFPVDSSKLLYLIDEIHQLNLSKYTEESVNNLNEILAEATALVTDNQYEIDQMCKKLEKAMNKLLLKGSFEELEALIETADNTINNDEDLYTYNSFNSLKLITSRAKKITSSSNETEISYFVNLLKQALNGLIKYNH